MMPWRYFEELNAYGYVWPIWSLIVLFGGFLLFSWLLAELSKKTDRKSACLPYPK